jgi:hypothetical protein
MTQRIKVNYNEEDKLQREYGVNVICGYARDVYQVGNKLECFCALDNKKCYHRIPMNEKECLKIERMFK